jgi:predicted glutamine amidotransferase
MSHFVACACNSAANLACALAGFDADLLLPAGTDGGWGLGYFSSGELLQRIEPLDRRDAVDAGSVLSGLRSNVSILHVREATVGAVRRENTHPFRFQEWLLAHNGTFAGFAGFRERLLEMMPPFIQRRMRGDTDSEHLFHLVLSFLYDSGRIGRPDQGCEAIRDALRQAVQTFDEFARADGRAPSPASIVLTDGYSLVALERGVPVRVALIQGVRDCPLCRISRASKGPPTPVNHDDLRAVLVRSGPSPAAHPAFHALGESIFLGVGRNLQVEFTPFA